VIKTTSIETLFYFYSDHCFYFEIDHKKTTAVGDGSVF